MNPYFYSGKVSHAAKALKDIQADRADSEVEFKKWQDKWKDINEKYDLVCKAMTPDNNNALGELQEEYIEASRQFKRQFNETNSGNEIREIALAYGRTVNAIDSKRAALSEQYVREKKALRRRRNAVESKMFAAGELQMMLIKRESQAYSWLEQASIEYAKSEDESAL